MGIAPDTLLLNAALALAEAGRAAERAPGQLSVLPAQTAQVNAPIAEIVAEAADDADLDAIVPVLVDALTVLAGRFCMTGSRLPAQRGMAGRPRDALAARLRAVRVGPASDPASEMRPLIDQANVRRVEGLVEEAIAAGARLVLRGGPAAHDGLAQGAFIGRRCWRWRTRRCRSCSRKSSGPC